MAEKIETINSNINEIIFVFKSEVEKVLSEIEIEKANELLETPREYID